MHEVIAEVAGNLIPVDVSVSAGEAIPVEVGGGSGGGGGGGNYEAASVSYTPTESQQTDEVTPSTGYDALSKVDVTVGAIPSNYVGSGIDRNDSTDMMISENNPPTVLAPAGYYASDATLTVPAGTAGTPVAVKGTVSSNSVTVTPKVTNSAGWIGGGTTTGTAVVVTASELVSGDKAITANGNNIDVTNYETVSVNVSGGGTTEAEKKAVNFIDYDGTILYSYTLAEAAALASMPSLPTHSGLTGDGWNYTLAEMKACASTMGLCNVGAQYKTTDEKTHLFITLVAGHLAPYLGVAPNGTATIDWGDGSANDTLTGSSFTSVKNVQHTYSAPGDYEIKITATSGSYAIYGATYSSTLLRKSTSNTANIHLAYTTSIKEIWTGKNCNVGNYAFLNCYGLENVMLSSLLTALGSDVLENCYSLRGVVIPKGVTALGTSALNGAHSLEIISLGAAFESLGTSSVRNCFSLQELPLPTTVTTLGQNCLSTASALTHLTVPSVCTSIGANAFSACYGVTEYKFIGTTPPTLANSNAFTNIQSDCKIRVPSSALATYQGASVWTTYSSYMEGYS